MIKKILTLYGLILILMLAIQTTTNDSMFPMQLKAQDNTAELGFGGETFCPFCNQPFGSCSCGAVNANGNLYDYNYYDYYFPSFDYGWYFDYGSSDDYYDPYPYGGGGDVGDVGGGSTLTPTPTPPTDDEVFDPYSVIYHNSNKQEISTEWLDDHISQYCYRVINGITYEWIFEGFDEFIVPLIEIFFDYEYKLISPDMMIQTKVTNYVIPTYNWSGKVTVANVNSKICAVVEYCDSYVGLRQIGKAKVSSRIIDVSSQIEMRQLWDEYTGWDYSIEDVRCGKPSIGQNLFVSCPI